jgi:hypothetical protein
MPNPGSIPLADLMGSLGSLVVFLMVGAVLLVFWQLAILLGALIANLRHRSPNEDARHLKGG